MIWRNFFQWERISRFSTLCTSYVRSHEFCENPVNCINKLMLIAVADKCFHEVYLKRYFSCFASISISSLYSPQTHCPCLKTQHYQWSELHDWLDIFEMYIRAHPFRVKLSDSKWELMRVVVSYSESRNSLKVDFTQKPRYREVPENCAHP